MAVSEKLQYTLTLSTVSTGTGARDTARDMERVAAATGAAGDKAKISQWGFYNLDEELKKTSQTSNTFQGEINKVGSSGRNAGMGVLMLSQGLEDAQYGMRGVLNNIPPMLMAFGASAGLAGVVSVAAVAFSVLYNWLGKTEEKSSDVAERLAEVGQKLENFHVEALERIRSELEDDLEMSNALEQKWRETQEAQDDYATSALDNAGRLREIQNGILELLGGQVDKQKELLAIAEQEEQKRRLVYEQAVAAEQQRLADAQAAVQDLQERRQLAEEDQAATLQSLEATKQRLEVLRQEKSLLEQMSKERSQSDDPGLQIVAAMGFDVLQKTPAAKGADQKLQDPFFNQQIDTISKQVENLQDQLDQIQGPGGIIPKQEIAITAAQTKAEDIKKSVEINTQRLEESFQIEDVEAKLKTSVEIAKQQAEDIKRAVGQIDVTNEAGKTAKETLTQAAADGQITAKESQKVADSVRTLIAQTQAGIATTSGNTQELLNLLRSVAEASARDRQAIEELKRQQELLLRRQN